MDEKYFIYSLQKKAEESHSRGTNKLDVTSYIEFERNMSEAEYYAKQTCIMQIYFWDELLKSNPSFEELERLSQEVDLNFKKANHHFRQMLQINDSNPKALRAYGSFLLDISNDQVLSPNFFLNFKFFIFVEYVIIKSCL